MHCVVGHTLLIAIRRFFDSQTRLTTVWHKMVRFFCLEQFSDACRVTALSATTSTTLQCIKITSRILQFFCYDYFEDLLASIAFAKNFGFLAGVASKIFANKNPFTTNHNGN